MENDKDSSPIPNISGNASQYAVGVFLVIVIKKSEQTRLIFRIDSGNIKPRLNIASFAQILNKSDLFKILY